MKVKSKIKLSTGVLQMKFMKRTVIEEQEEIALEEQKKQIDDEHWYLSIEESKMSESSNVRNVLVEASYSIFDEIGFGRMSFNGFNPQIEKITNPHENVKQEASDEKEVEDELMAEHYQNTLQKTISAKFSRIHHKNAKTKVKRFGT